MTKDIYIDNSPYLGVDGIETEDIRRGLNALREGWLGAPFELVRAQAHSPPQRVPLADVTSYIAQNCVTLTLRERLGSKEFEILSGNAEVTPQNIAATGVYVIAIPQGSFYPYEQQQLLESITPPKDDRLLGVFGYRSCPSLDSAANL